MAYCSYRNKGVVFLLLKGCIMCLRISPAVKGANIIYVNLLPTPRFKYSTKFKKNKNVIQVLFLNTDFVRDGVVLRC